MHVYVCVCVYIYAQSLSHVWLFATPWTVAHQVPLPMEFSRLSYWSWVPFFTIYIYIHTYSIYVYIYTYTYIHMHIYMHIYIHVYMHIYIYTHTHVYTYVIYTHHSFYINSSMDGHLGCFHILTVINNAAVTTAVLISFQISVFIFFQ